VLQLRDETAGFRAQRDKEEWQRLFLRFLPVTVSVTDLLQGLHLHGGRNQQALASKIMDF
jgi:hypothetical protein